eukprot:1066487-Prorocentrum_minimum.AAC.1
MFRFFLATNCEHWKRFLQVEDADAEASEAAAAAKAQTDRAQMTSLTHASLDVLPPSGSMRDWGAETQAGVVSVPEEIGPEAKGAAFGVFGALLDMSAGPAVAEGLSAESGGSIARGLASLVAAPVAGEEELTDTAAGAVGMLEQVGAQWLAGLSAGEAAAE